jgi:hypothetical protein
MNCVFVDSDQSCLWIARRIASSSRTVSGERILELMESSRSEVVRDVGWNSSQYPLALHLCPRLVRANGGDEQILY